MITEKVKEKCLLGSLMFHFLTWWCLHGCDYYSDKPLKQTWFVHLFEGYILIKHPPKNWGIKGARHYYKRTTCSRKLKTEHLRLCTWKSYIPLLRSLSINNISRETKGLFSGETESDTLWGPGDQTQKGGKSGRGWQNAIRKSEGIKTKSVSSIQIS